MWNWLLRQLNFSDEFIRHLGDVKLDVQKRPNGTYVATVRSNQPLSEPFVDILIDMTWSSGKITRAYTFLLDPAGAKPSNQAFSPTTVTCRASAGICDVAETCDGTGAACPGDGFAATSVVCRTSPPHLEAWMARYWPKSSPKAPSPIPAPSFPSAVKVRFRCRHTSHVRLRQGGCKRLRQGGLGRGRHK